MWITPKLNTKTFKNDQIIYLLSGLSLSHHHRPKLYKCIEKCYKTELT